MLPRVQLPAEFRAWRVASVLLSPALAGLGVWETRLLSGAGGMPETMAAGKKDPKTSYLDF